MASKKITKSDLIDSLAEETKAEKKVLLDFTDNLLKIIKNELISGSTIELRGFGTFEPRLRKGREVARNPRTGEQLSVEPHYVVAFKPGQELKKSVWDLKIDE